MHKERWLHYVRAKYDLAELIHCRLVVGCFASKKLLERSKSARNRTLRTSTYLPAIERATIERQPQPNMWSVKSLHFCGLARWPGLIFPFSFLFYILVVRGTRIHVK